MTDATGKAAPAGSGRAENTTGEQSALTTAEIATWFQTQASACENLDSPFYSQLLSTIAELLPTDLTELVGSHWRFGDMLPLRLMGMCHGLALAGDSAPLAAAFPSCGGSGQVTPGLAKECIGAWYDHSGWRQRYLTAAVQTNEVGRSAALAIGLDRFLQNSPGPCRLVEIGPSAGLNLRLDQFAYLADGVVLAGREDSPVRIEDVWRPTSAWGPETGTEPPVWELGDRIGFDPSPIDPCDPVVSQRLRSYVWPDQIHRLHRLEAAIEVAKKTPADLVQTNDTASSLRNLLSVPAPGGTLIMQSIVWMYIPRDKRWAITKAIEAAGAAATAHRPLGWLTFEVDEYDRSRAAVTLRQWPGGGGRLLAHADFHGRWVQLLD
jgi:hypothetical protein